MSPTYTMSAHLCKQIAASWKEIRHPLEPAGTGAHFPSSFPRASSPTGSDTGKRSMDSDRSDSSAPSMTRTASNSSSTWKWSTR
ncbi:hypothetical protein KVR01_001197 [Diaporthe batatas]|uniref:uncharacterized protein n=1 Tax=Diaporthe batatas TaxID=748121 RepID=UPI001D043C5A|nr:uncharacterized protein KVR01_001197 [Diaporthe batatas]KAG8168448.1 hypothetical protein KVR01_001197 [Diaporthe batatas]